MRKTVKELIHLIIKIVLVAIIIFILTHFVFGVYRANGNSMYPNIKDGDLVITYRLEKPVTGDIVVYDANKKSIFYRVLGKEKDTINIKNGLIYINDIQSTDKNLYDTVPGNLQYPFEIPHDSVFLLHDYRPDTNDSRTFGAVNRKNLSGKVIFILRRRSF